MKKAPYSIFILLTIVLFSCKQNKSAIDTGNLLSSAATPVTITSPDSVHIKEEISFNAISSYLLKSSVKATTNGYIQSSAISLGDRVRKGQTIFTLKTKEAESLGNTINNLDPSFHFTGINSIRSPSDGYITKLNHLNGDYVQDGEILAEIASLNSFGFIMNLPYEYNQLFSKNKIVDLVLPDSTIVKGVISQRLPSLDSISQTQKVLIKIPSSLTIPENLIARVTLVKKIAQNPSIAKEAVLSDASQQNFWVMKLINDSTAIKVPVKKGIESSNQVEILSPTFTNQDKILLTGNYGLADTAKVIVKNSQALK
ncbi:MAG: HlyD family efflux transporter periplasmic adaptor subunit [Ginsengibacter sp.]